MTLERCSVSVQEKTGFSQCSGVEVIVKKVATCLLSIRSFWGPTELPLGDRDCSSLFRRDQIWVTTRLPVCNHPYPCVMLLQLGVTAAVLPKSPRLGCYTCLAGAWIWCTPRCCASYFLKRKEERRDVLRIWCMWGCQRMIQFLQGTTWNYTQLLHYGNRVWDSAPS